MSVDELFSGSCLCGGVRFQVDSAPNSTSVCHCRSCQRAAGADSVAWASFPAENVVWSGKKKSVYSSSSGIERTFCSQCGTSLSYQNAASSVEVVLACFENPETFAPEKEIWLDHRLSWNPRNTNIPGYRQFRSDGPVVD